MFTGSQSTTLLSLSRHHNRLAACIVAMLTRMAMKFDGVAESGAEVHANIDYDYEHPFAEHEHDDADEP